MLSFFISLFIIMNWCARETGSIFVTIEGINHKNGKMMIGLFDNADDFTITPVEAFRIPVDNDKSITVEFTDIEYGIYAVSVYHDINENGELDKNMLGIPVEPYGFSNNPRIITGPSYEKSTFTLNKKELNLTVQLH